MKKDILPTALRLAATGCDDPKWIGEILLSLVGKPVKGLDKGQNVVVAMCRAEISERAASREASRVRKAASRAKNGGAR